MEAKWLLPKKQALNFKNYDAVAERSVSRRRN